MSRPLTASDFAKVNFVLFDENICPVYGFEYVPWHLDPYKVIVCNPVEGGNVKYNVPPTRCIPILRPISDITEEEVKILAEGDKNSMHNTASLFQTSAITIDYLDSIQVDCRGYKKGWP